MTEVPYYEEQVYNALLGKVIGVYSGRPFENWPYEKIKDKWGFVDRYVHEDLDVPLIVSDDDISGTLTFIRAIEDSKKYAKTSAEDFGRAWLNYLIEGNSVLWWGGVGMSTEHTAYHRLKGGLKPPLTGSIQTNTQIVAEQIGAQIFIDSIGWITPGNPTLAAKLARNAACVSHDGEALYAAIVVAVMNSAGFVEKDMKKLLDLGMSFIPQDSLIAEVHQNVRQWSQKNKNWEDTFKKIQTHYGYTKFPGGCHIIPNHAVMVMAWSYAPRNFHQAISIVNSAGWDTDCNAGNVGSLMGLILGLSEINRDYEYQKPFADQIYVPTAEGTKGVSDILTESLSISQIGRKVMNWPIKKSPKQGAYFHFENPRALQGFILEEKYPNTSLNNSSKYSLEGSRTLHLSYKDLAKGQKIQIRTPLLPPTARLNNYQLMGTPKLYSHMCVTLKGICGQKTIGSPDLKMSIHYYEEKTQQPIKTFTSKPVHLIPGKSFHLDFTIPDTQGWPIDSLGINIENGTTGDIYIDSISFSGNPKIKFPTQLPLNQKGQLIGWVDSVDRFYVGSKFNGKDHSFIVTKNNGRGTLVTGNMEWKNYSFEFLFQVNLAKAAGMVMRYQGLERYLACIILDNKLKLIMRYYEDILLDECAISWNPHKSHLLKISCSDKNISVDLDHQRILQGEDHQLLRGGFGFLVEEGAAGFSHLVAQSCGDT